MDKTRAVVWLGRDLRLGDNPAIEAAQANHDSIALLYIYWDEHKYEPDFHGKDPRAIKLKQDKFWRPGAASRYWLHCSLQALQRDIAKKGGRLIIRQGDACEQLLRVCAESGAQAAYWNRLYEPRARDLQSRIETDLEKNGISWESFPGNLLIEPWKSVKTDGTPYRVFGAFARTCQDRLKHNIMEATPMAKPFTSNKIGSNSLESLGLLPRVAWTKGIDSNWQQGEAAAQMAFGHFLEKGIADYEEQRNFPDQENGVSKLSPYLHFGEISIRQIWRQLKEFAHRNPREKESAETFEKELLWREFSHHLLYYFPDMPDEPLHKEFLQYPWRTSGAGLKAWQSGRTGYPIVDAGMRQLWATGWMHNRVRMIVGSFLVKDLDVAWQSGEIWFWDTLVDADLAQNSMNWQWVAGCGVDAAPFFRIFNPVKQGQRFDPNGEYVREWIPEIRHLPSRWIHNPWEAPSDVLRQAGVVLGKDYPKPIVNHDTARKQALSQYKNLKK